MPLVQLFSPAVDIVIICVVFNALAYIAYAWLYGREFNKVALVDLRLSIAQFLLLVANYAPRGVMVSVFGWETNWLWWYVVVSVPLEFAAFFGYKWYFGLDWNDIQNGPNTK